MKKNLIAFSIIAAAVLALPGFRGASQAASQAQSSSQNRDLCGGTGGIGGIVSIGREEFTIKRHDTGTEQLIYLAKRATIETSNGNIQLPELKVGDSVTLVGDPNKDGSFTADAVVVCAGALEAEIQGNEANRNASRIEQNGNTDYKKVSGIIHALTIILAGLIWLGAAAYLRLKKKKSLVYLLFFAIFYIYLYKVLDYTLLQFQSLLLLQRFVPGLLLNGLEAGKSINLIPFGTLTFQDVKTSLLNILMMVPFGFGLPFIANFRFRKVAIAGLLLSVVIELLQFITGFVANTSFRVADVNDLIFNTAGAAIGYVLFVAFMRAFRHLFRNGKVLSNPVLRYIAGRPQANKN